MTRIALINGQVPASVANVIVGTDVEFAETLGYDHAVECGDDVGLGYIWDGTAFAAPLSGDSEPPAPTEPQYRTTMTPIRFKAQFSVQEQVAIKRARAYVDGADADGAADAQKAFTRDALGVLFDSLDDPRLTEVDVKDPSVIGGIEFCQSVGILTEARAAEIKRGVPATA